MTSHKTERRRFILWTGLPVLLSIVVTAAVVSRVSNADTKLDGPSDVIWYSIDAPPSTVWPRTVACASTTTKNEQTCVSSQGGITHKLADAYVVSVPNQKLTFAELGLLVCQLPASLGEMDCTQWDGSPMRIPREVAIYRPL